MDAKQYWKEKHSNYSQQDWIIKPTIFAKFAIQYFPRNSRLLELGAGQGQDSRYFAKLGFTVVSTDFSEEAIEISKRKSEEEKLQIKFLNIDLQRNLPFPKKSFDIIYAHLALQFFDQKRTENLFSEIADITKQAGILAILLNTIDDPEISKSKRLVGGLYETPSGLVKSFFSLDRVKKLTEKNFKTLVLDNKGETYKDEVKTLIRYIGIRK